MKRSQDIEILRMAAEIQSLQSQLAFYMEKAENSVPVEKHEAVIAERDAAIAESAAKDRIHAEELAAKDRELKEYREAQALLQTENTDFKTLWEFWQRHHFGASSETMTEMMDQVVGKLPTSGTAMLADILSVVDRINHMDGSKTLPVAPAD